MKQLTMALGAVLVVVQVTVAAAAQNVAARLAVTDGEIAYDTGGPADAPAVVFLHGAFMDRTSWDRLWPIFAKQYHVVRYDIRPFGESTAPTKPYTVPDDLLRLLDHLKIARAHLIGHSFGGGVALDFALMHPDRVASLVLVSAGPGGFAPPAEEQKDIMAIFAAVKDGDDAILKAWIAHPMWAASRDRPDVAKELTRITRRNLAPFRLRFAPYAPITPPAIERLGQVRAPTLIVVGDRDTAGNRKASEVMAAGIPGAALRTIPGADHALPVAWPDELSAAAIGFISTTRR